MTSASKHATQLAAGLAGRLLHDIAGAASGIATGVDLYDDPGSDSLRAEALDLVRSGDRALRERIAFARAAYGGASDPCAGEAVGRLCAIPFANGRARLVWDSSIRDLEGAAIPAMLILAQVAATALAAGGEAHASATSQGGVLRLSVTGKGRRPRLHPEVLAGIAGTAPEGGMTGRWAPACFLNLIVTAGGGTLRADSDDESFVLEAALPIGVSPGPG